VKDKDKDKDFGLKDKTRTFLSLTLSNKKSYSYFSVGNIFSFSFVLIVEKNIIFNISTLSGGANFW